MQIAAPMAETAAGSVAARHRQDCLGFVALVGPTQWAARLADISRDAGAGRHAGRVLLQRHAIELAIQRLCRGGTTPSPAEQRIASLCGDALALAEALDDAGRARLSAALQAGLAGSATLVPLFHQLRTAALQRGRGFEVVHAGLAEGAPFDLLLRRQGQEAELACEVVSAEAGRDVHRGAWLRLMDRIDPELQTWLAAHPGRYLLKMTLPQGLKETGADGGALAALHERISALLATQTRSDQDEAAVLRLDPLLLAAAQADELGLMPRLRQEFGPQAHLAVTTAGTGLVVLAARSSREDTVAVAVRQRMADIAAERLTGTRPGILAMFVEDTDKAEWHGLRDRLELEGETRQFLTLPQARPVVAVSCTSRIELFGLNGAADDELRFRNPAHPAAKAVGLAPAVLSSV